ncbi:MAG TPA: ChbG/HpnK family deacetylase [Terriglobales bacterium]|nr:ChbG/HpnK family deacetylase [Terriglobales bacterium]
MRRLIINADDFGLTAGVNRSILECHQAGTVTSATLMANAQAFDDAVTLARSAPNLRVGCHAMLVDGAPLTPPTEVTSLLAPGQHKDFRIGIAGFAHAALRGKLHADEITREATAQMRRLQSAGIDATHFDTHKHTHMFPQVLRPLLRAARECGVRAVRNPFAPLKALPFATFLKHPRFWVRYTEVSALRRFARAFQIEVEAAGLRTTQGTFGVVATGGLDQRLFDALIGSVPEGTWEFVCHPGYNDSDLDGVATRLRASRVQEMKVLTSPQSLETLRRNQIQLITFADI